MRAAPKPGTAPTIKPQRIATTAVNVTTVQLTVISLSRGVPAGAQLTSKGVTHAANTMPAAAPSTRERQRLDQHLLQQAAPISTQRGSQSELALTGHASGQQQVCDIDARHDQHDRNAAEQQEQLLPHAANGLLVQRHHLSCPAAVGVGIRLRELTPGHIHVGARRIKADAALQPGDHADHARIAIDKGTDRPATVSARPDQKSTSLDAEKVTDCAQHRRIGKQELRRHHADDGEERGGRR